MTLPSLIAIVALTPKPEPPPVPAPAAPTSKKGKGKGKKTTAVASAPLVSELAISTQAPVSEAPTAPQKLYSTDENWQAVAFVPPSTAIGRNSEFWDGVL